MTFLAALPIDLTKILTLVALLLLLQAAGYLATRIFRERVALPLVGLFGGLISSTATVVRFAELNGPRNSPRETTKVGQLSYASVAACLFAMAASLFEVLIILSPLSVNLMQAIFIPFISMIGACVVGVLVYAHLPQHPVTLKQKPFSILSAIKLTAIIVAFIIVASLAQQLVGDKAVLTVSFLGGLFEIHGVAIATADLYEQSSITLNLAVKSVMIAALASFLSKGVLVATLAKTRFAIVMVLSFGAVAAIGAAAFLLTSSQ